MDLFGGARSSDKDEFYFGTLSLRFNWTDDGSDLIQSNASTATSGRVLFFVSLAYLGGKADTANEQRCEQSPLDWTNGR